LSDFHLFDRLLGLSGADLDARAGDYLARFELEGKVQVENGVFSTTALSSGQRKRLALLTSLLEDRPIYVFDEWAADQDTHFRDVFYTAIPPSSRSSGARARRSSSSATMTATIGSAIARSG
jgi:putative ATP-binding cassette transporter